MSFRPLLSLISSAFLITALIPCGAFAQDTDKPEQLASTAAEWVLDIDDPQASSEIAWDTLKEGTDYVAGEFLITFYPTVSRSDAENFIDSNGWVAEDPLAWYEDEGWKCIPVRIDESQQSLKEAMATAELSSLVWSVELDRILQFLDTPASTEGTYSEPLMDTPHKSSTPWSSRYDWDTVPDKYDPHTLFLFFADDVSYEEASALVESLGWTNVSWKDKEDDERYYYMDSYFTVELPQDVSLKDALDVAYAQDEIVDARLNGLLHFLDGETTSNPSTTDDSSSEATEENTWYLENANIPEAWELSKTAGQVSVAILDTGIYNVPDLVDNIDYENGWDAANESSLGDPLSSHGTTVAGLIAARAGNDLGIDGISYNANIVPINVAFTSESGEITTSCGILARAINHILDSTTISNLRVINISAGLYGEQDEIVSLQRAINRAVDSGVSVVCAAGNSGTDADIYPSDLRNTISVMATDESNAKWDWGFAGSDYGYSKTLCAPGDNILSTSENTGENYLATSSGTSCSAAIVSGVLALMYAADPDLTPNTAQYILETTATDLGDEGYDPLYGYGLLDAQAALQEVVDTETRTSIAQADVTGIPAYAYTSSSELSPSPCVTVEGVQLQQGVDYTVEYQYSDSENYLRQITIIGKGSYYGAISITMPVYNLFTRVSGEYALDTMKAIVESAYIDCDEGLDAGSNEVIVATMSSYYDALTASGLAGILDCPVVMTDGSSLSDQAADVISELGASKVYVIGGTSAVSANVVAQIRALSGVTSVDRVAGDDASQTALEIYYKGCDEGSWGDTCIICTIDYYQDGMAASPYAFAKNAPIFLVNSDHVLDSSVLSAIQTAGFSKAIIMGGTSVVSPAVESQLSFLSVWRASGSNSMETAQLFAERCLQDGMDCSTVVITTATSYYDGLCGSAFCGRLNAPLLYDYPGYTQYAVSFLTTHNSEFTHGYVLGGTSAVSESSMAAYATAVS